MKAIFNNISNFLLNNFYLLGMIFLTLSSIPAKAQELSKEEYLKRNVATITVDGNNESAIFDEAFYNNQVFLVSESHGYSKPQEVDFELFKQINKKTGVRYYIAEVDFSQAYNLNQYLTTGDETFLKSIYQYWYDQQAQWGCKAGFEKWQKMYAYNKTLAANKKIIVLGLDETQDYNMNVQLLGSLLAKSKYEQGKNAQLDSIAFFANQNLSSDSIKKLFIRYSRRLNEGIQANSTSFKKILKANYFSFEYIISNTATKKQRETRIFDNFNTYYKEYKLEDQKFYGFWGRFHAMQDSVNGALPFAGMLTRSNLGLKNKVVSLPVFCLESSSMLPTSMLPPMAQQAGTIFSKSPMVNDESFVYKVAGISVFKKVVPENTIGIVKLNAAGSPYNKGLDLLESSSTMDKTFEWKGNKIAATTDYFQYAVIARGSDWAVPYGDNVENKK